MVLLKLDPAVPNSYVARVRLQTPHHTEFHLQDLSCNESFLKVESLGVPSNQPGLQVLSVRYIQDTAPKSELQAEITVKTDVPGAKELVIPVVLLPPSQS